MTVFVPNTLMSLHRDVSTDEFGDPVDDNTVAESSDLPAVITEKSQRTFLPEELRMDMVQKFVIRLRPGTDVREGDRLQDQFTNAIYQVQEVVVTPNVVMAGDVRVYAVKVAAPSTSARTTRK